jgi:hypothetical protein
MKRISELALLGRPLNVRSIQISEPTLASAAERHFDSWADALAATGIDPSRCTRRVPTWTPDRVVRALRQMHRDGHAINHAAVRCHSLSRAAVKLFGSWDAALREAGLDPAGIRRRRQLWTDEGIIADLRQKHRCGEPLNAKDVQPRSIFRAARRLFGSWDAALTAAGLDPSTIRRDRQGG